MTVYVDNMRAKFGQMIMCHMMADDDSELLEMANRIGVDARWHQYPGTPKSHFDICLNKRKKAVAFGAVELTTKELIRKCRDKRRFADC